MIVDLGKGRGWPITLYDTDQDTLFVRTRDEDGGREPEYWRPHPEHPGLLVGYVLGKQVVRDDYDDPVRLESYDQTVALKLLRASLEPRWSAVRSAQLHANGALFYEGVPGMGEIHEMCHAMTSLGEWLDSRQLSFNFGR
jgi:hypothetical protein